LLRNVFFIAALFGLWLLLSGPEHFSPLLLSFGLLSCLAVAYLANKMGLIDAEGFPIQILPRLFIYIPWLLVKIIQSNIDVCRQILAPRLKLEPSTFTVRCTQKTDLGKVIYANSITLTPGTISLSINNNEIEVHALNKDAIEDLKSGEMDRRVSQLMDKT